MALGPVLAHLWVLVPTAAAALLDQNLALGGWLLIAVFALAALSAALLIKGSESWAAWTAAPLGYFFACLIAVGVKTGTGSSLFGTIITVALDLLRALSAQMPLALAVMALCFAIAWRKGQVARR